MVQAGWHGIDQIYREYPLRAGRVMVRGNKSHRDKDTVLRADYALFFKANIPIATVEAKDNSHAMGAGMSKVLKKKITTTGVFTTALANDVKLFQRRVKLPVNGRVGPNTWKVLTAAAALTSP